MGKTKLEREEEKNEIALFRFSVISPLVSNPNEYKSKEEFYRTAALKKYVLPDGTETSFSAGLIKKWYIDYTKNGFDVLRPKTRIDRGASRKIPVECIEKINALMKQYPHITRKGNIPKISRGW